MMLFDLLKNIYTKHSGKCEVDSQMRIVLTKWLGYDRDNLQKLSELIPYIFYIAPIHFYYLLYFHVPKKVRPPFLKKVIKIDFKTSPPLIHKLRHILGWSSMEYLKNKEVVDKVILENKKYWKKELGVK